MSDSWLLLARAEPGPPLGAAGTGTLSNEDIGARLDELFRLRSAVDGRITELLGEVARREAYRDEGATST